MKKLVVLLLVSLMASSAFAVADPDPNMMGFYFDMGADQNCLEVGVNIPFFCYVIVTNPTIAAIDAYEFHFTNEVPVGLDGLWFQLANNIANGAASGVDVGVSNKLGGDVIVGLATPIPCTSATIVHSWQYMLLTAMSVPMYLTGSSVPSLPGGLPVIQEAGGDLMLVGTSTGGDPAVPVAGVNLGTCPVAVENETWGSLKSLYR